MKYGNIGGKQLNCTLCIRNDEIDIFRDNHVDDEAIVVNFSFNTAFDSLVAEQLKLSFKYLLTYVTIPQLMKKIFIHLGTVFAL